jgi:diguanylate cyclase (GGDEF)-like protein
MCFEKFAWSDANLRGACAVVNSASSEANTLGENEDRASGANSCTDTTALLLAKLELTCRELARVNQRLVRLRSAERRHRAMINQLRMLATTDVLTGLVNRRRFDQILHADFKASVARGKALSLIMVDVDSFKSYNDTFGHSAGDAVLTALARYLLQSARPDDVVARYGGDEFAILLRDADVRAARSCAERYVQTITSVPWPQRPVAASFGVATRTASITNPAALLEHADRALYQSKRGGQMRVIHSETLEKSAIWHSGMPITSPAEVWGADGADCSPAHDGADVEQPTLGRGPETC